MKNINTKLIYKLARNKKTMSLNMQEEIITNLNKGDKIFIITKNGIEKDFIGDKKIYTEKSIFIVCQKHRICVKDIGYSVFPKKKQAKKRVKKLMPKANRLLFERNAYNLDAAFDLVDTAQFHIDKYFDILKKLDKKYPIEGYMWTFDPNDIAVGLQKDLSEYYNDKKALNRQYDCVHGKHMLVELSDSIYWCQNCGTVIKTNEQLSISKRNPFNKVEDENAKYYYPMVPHFLPKKK